MMASKARPTVASNTNVPPRNAVEAMMASAVSRIRPKRPPALRQTRRNTAQVVAIAWRMSLLAAFDAGYQAAATASTRARRHDTTMDVIEMLNTLRP